MTGAFIAGFAGLIFLFFQSQGISGGDSGDLVTSAIIRGIPHPPGYPLYTFFGWVISHIPYGTPAWRMGILSSLPHAVTLAFVYIIVCRLTKKPLAGIFAALMLFGNYVFFLYSVTAEVFAVFDLLFVLLLFVLIRWQETGRFIFLLWAAFFIGISVSHHHIMALALPGLVFFVLHNRRSSAIQQMRSWKTALLLGASFFVGVLPYLYVPIASAARPIIDWDHATTVSGFVRLITRRDYGSFQSGGAIGESIAERLIAVRAYADFIYIDLTVFGLILVAFGLWFLWKRNRSFVVAWIITIVLFGPFFFFYASFPLVNRFTLATYERFLLPSYILLSIAAGAGFVHFKRAFTVAIRVRFGRNARTVLRTLFVCVVFLYPLFQIGVKVKLFNGLSTDRTADNLGIDMLDSLPQRAVLLLSQDTALFSAQYVRYALGYRKDTAVIHNVMLGSREYRKTLETTFPQLVFPKEESSAYPLDFIRANATISGVFANTALPLPQGWHWVPQGILLEATEFSHLPDVDHMYRANQALWGSYHDPHAGILSSYRHLMLSDVLNIYANSRIQLAKTLINATRYTEAIQELDKAVGYGGDISRIEAYTQRGIAKFGLKDCGGALLDFHSARNESPFSAAELYLYESVTYRECVGDVKKADELYRIYEREKPQKEQLLEQL